MCARRTADDQEDVCGTKEESGRQLQLPDVVFEKPRVGLRTADINEDLCPERLKPESPRIKEEVEDKGSSHIKEEEEEPEFPIVKEEESERPHIEQQLLSLQPHMKKEKEEPSYIKKRG
ncbi:uncharacterized protein LOC133413661 isoform X2 [Phycodurus eques]|uniref:uncharacterized protein LOC133413661 isoform X2 n=1 Tax=Phycodurus eques TaxID=693459 RepID=UPI002ACD5834|nr:uncharacterized protein LOC133413661 isoform X2 [Phycodurus eques]